jgi:ABC-2 type transport system ATP-binding protein
MSEPQPPDRQPVGGVRRVVYIGLGLGFVGLAVVGVVLPLLPTTPFLLLASYFFVRSSPRLNEWLLRSRVFGPFLRDWHQHRGVRRGVKVTAVTVIPLVILISAYFGRLSVPLVVLLVLLGLIGLMVVCRLPVIKDREEDVLLNPLLRTENLTKYYGQFCALDSLNLSVAPGEIFGLLGPNGSGKSTAIRLLLGLMKPTAGAAYINGHHCWRDSVAARRQVAYLPGELRLYENMTGWRLVQFLGSLRERVHRDEVERLAQEFDIDLGRPIAHLSSGMKRKLALIEVLAAHTPLLILDEPTNTLDPTMRDALLRQLRCARDRGQAVLFSSHVLAEVEQVCDRVGILQKGRLVHLQPMAELRQARRLRVRLGGALEKVPEFPGLWDVRQEQDLLTLHFDGPLEPVLTWLAGQAVQELTVESGGLDAAYRKYHGNDG